MIREDIKLSEAIKIIESHIQNPRDGLPEELFLFLTRLTPMLNIDLLIRDERKRILMSWRDDPVHGKGWHIPGGIVRYQEKIETRLFKVMENEIGLVLKYEKDPILTSQIIAKKIKNRGHFVSLLYDCFLPSDVVVEKMKWEDDRKGKLQWFDHCPEDLLFAHDVYKHLFD